MLGHFRSKNRIRTFGVEVGLDGGVTCISGSRGSTRLDVRLLICRRFRRFREERFVNFIFTNYFMHLMDFESLGRHPVVDFMISLVSFSVFSFCKTRQLEPKTSKT